THLEVLPGLPTVDEFVPGYEASSWYGVGAPKGFASLMAITAAQGRQRDRTEGAKAACEGCGYPEGGQVARDRNWHGPAHLKGASNEPARGGPMTSGSQLTNSLLRRA